jgi:hypothetical protein
VPEEFVIFTNGAVFGHCDDCRKDGFVFCHDVSLRGFSASVMANCC